MGQRWYVARSIPRAEFLAANELKKDGIQVYFPRVRAVQPRSGHPDAPLFPGYLFLKLDAEADGWPTFRPAHRVIGWIRFGGEIPWLSDQAVSELMDYCEGVNQKGGLWSRFRAGERVYVDSNGLEGLAEVVKEAKSPDARVQVLLQFMGRLVRAQVPWQNLRSADHHDELRDAERMRLPRRTRGHNRWIRGYGPAAAART